MTPEAALLHVIPQQMQHDEAVIAGTRAALVALRNAIGRALSGGTAVTAAMPNDGEGYWLCVACVTADEMKTVPLGYAAEAARDDTLFPVAIDARLSAEIAKASRK